MSYLQTSHLEIAWGLNNAKHGDDQVLVICRDEAIALVVADGVTDSRPNGRLAAAIVAYHIGAILNEALGHLDLRSIDGVEQFMQTVVQQAVERTRQEIEQLSQAAILDKSGNDLGVLQKGLKKGLSAVSKKLEAIKSIWREGCIGLGLDPCKGQTVGLLNSVVESVKDSQQRFALFQSTYPRTERLKEIIGFLPKGADETDVALLKRLRNDISGHDPGAWDSQATLCFALLFLWPSANDTTLRMLSLCLGDSGITILSPERLWVKHYDVRTGGITTFVSTKTGVVGTPDIASRVVYPDEVILFYSDGVDPLWTTPSGMPGVPFRNLVKQQVQAGSIARVPELWFDYLQDQNALTDDASLIIARVMHCAPTIPSTEDVSC